MFDLKRPCVTCPFRRGQGETFGLPRARLEKIFAAPAFQCHKTVDYAEGADRQGDKPQQCAGLMAVLVQDGADNQIMQVGARLGAFDPDVLVLEDAYPGRQAVFQAHDAEEKR